MWQIDNRTPFASAQSWVRNREGAETWLVAVKATFGIHPDGSVHVSAEQPPVLRSPEYWGEPGKSSLRYEADLILTKTTTDIVLNGHAYAPGGQPVSELDVGFRVGPVTKLLRVVGDRKWTSLGPSKPDLFTKMPLIYERAFGGVDIRAENPERHWEWRNPVGVGFATGRHGLVGRALHNVEAHDKPIGYGRPSPGGFGPIASHWQPRASFAGTYDETWLRTRQPLLPHDFDDRFFQCAPSDQQAPDFLHGGEPVILRNMTLNADLRFLLPELSFVFETRFVGGDRCLNPSPRLHTVILEPDFPRVSLVWHSAMECHAKAYELENTKISMRRSGTADDDMVEDLLDLT